MHEEKTEGIVLRSQDFKERHRILTLFTPEGLINLIVKNISRKNMGLLSLTTPFCHGEYHYQRRHSSLLHFQDGTILDDHFNFRQNLQFLQTAGTLASAILASQLPDKPSAALFSLYKSYHKQVLNFKNPTSLLTSFLLKLLKHEGLLTIAPHCNHCDHSKASLLHNGESYCRQHHFPNALYFSVEDWENLLHLDNAQKFSALQQIHTSPELFEQINHLFYSRLSN